MATAVQQRSKFENLAELLHQLGDVPLERIRMEAPPGTATERDVLAVRAGPERRLCELVDGVLVEKAMSTRSSFLITVIIQRILNFIEKENLGVVLGADGMIRTFP